jgi:hypothetical protein
MGASRLALSTGPVYPCILGSMVACTVYYMQQVCSGPPTLSDMGHVWQSESPDGLFFRNAILASTRDVSLTHYSMPNLVASYPGAIRFSTAFKARLHATSGWPL